MGSTIPEQGGNTKTMNLKGHYRDITKKNCGDRGLGTGEAGGGNMKEEALQETQKSKETAPGRIQQET